jgi:hypothetical protein
VASAADGVAAAAAAAAGAAGAGAASTTDGFGAGGNTVELGNSGAARAALSAIAVESDASKSGAAPIASFHMSFTLRNSFPELSNPFSWASTSFFCFARFTRPMI